MIRIRINLLPREIKARQREQKLIAMAFLAMIIVACLLGALYTFNTWQIKVAKDQVAMVADQVTKMNGTIQQLRVYEQRAQEVQHKKQVLDTALANIIEWSKMLEELMMVTPNDVSLASLSGNSDGITFSGSILDPRDAPDGGHKPVAKWLTRLTDIHPQPDVWLNTSAKQGENSIQFTNAIKFTNSPTLSAPPKGTGK